MLVCNQIEVETLIPILFLSPGGAVEKMDAVCLGAVVTQGSCLHLLMPKAVVMSILAQKPSLWLWYPTESYNKQMGPRSRKAEETRNMPVCVQHAPG